MNCPICNNAMLLYKKNGIKSEYCPQCNEIWPSKSFNKITTRRAISIEDRYNKGYNPMNHIYSRTNNHVFMDDKKRNKVLLFYIE